ncbi:MAG TPA: YciI family protein [Gemmatimonadaceae bacterium]
MSTTASNYLLIFRETALERYDDMSHEQRLQAMRRWNGWLDALVAQGKMQGGNTLDSSARIVSNTNGTRTVDGPFAEAKELIAGYILLTVSGLHEATAIAEQCPFLEYGMTVEVRAVAQACHLARALGWETMREPATA